MSWLSCLIPRCTWTLRADSDWPVCCAASAALRPNNLINVMACRCFSGSCDKRVSTSATFDSLPPSDGCCVVCAIKVSSNSSCNRSRRSWRRQKSISLYLAIAMTQALTGKVESYVCRRVCTASSVSWTMSSMSSGVLFMRRLKNDRKRWAQSCSICAYANSSPDWACVHKSPISRSKGWALGLTAGLLLNSLKTG